MTFDASENVYDRHTTNHSFVSEWLHTSAACISYFRQSLAIKVRFYFSISDERKRKICPLFPRFYSLLFALLMCQPNATTKLFIGQFHCGLGYRSTHTQTPIWRYIAYTIEMVNELHCLYRCEVLFFFSFLPSLSLLSFLCHDVIREIWFSFGFRRINSLQLSIQYNILTEFRFLFLISVD